MNADTISALLALNRRFYQHHAADFDATRGRPWPGWRRVLARLPHEDSHQLSVLDLGCGNGRLASYLRQEWRGSIDYLGLDGSTALLAAAADRCRHLARARLVAYELVAENLAEVLEDQRFDFIAVFGVLHHVPATANRRSLVRELGDHLSPEGILALSIWQPNRDPGFERKTVSWKRYNRRHRRRPQRGRQPAAPILDLGELEAGDHLLSWRGREHPPRYCHFPEAAEIDGWIAASGLRLLDRFEADGPSGGDNLYLLLGRGNIER